MNLSLLRPLLALTTKTELLAALLAGFLSAVCSIGLMGTAAWLISKAALQPPLYALTLGITMVRACGIGRAAFRYLDRWFSHRLAFRCYAQLQLKLYAKAESAIPLRDGSLHQGDFLHQLLDSCETLRDFYLRALLPAGVITLLTFLCLLTLYERTPLGTLLLATLWLLHLLLPAVAEPVNLELAESKQGYRTAIMEIGSGGAELVQTDNYQHLFPLLDQPSDRFQQCQRKQSSLQDRTDWILGICRQFSFVLLFYLLGMSMLQTTISAIELSVWLLMILALFQEYPSLSAAIRVWKDSLHAADMLQCPSGSKPTPEYACEQVPASDITEDRPLLAVRDLSFAYQSGVPILDNLSFSLYKGQHTAILGESGSGKTTLGYLLLRLWHPDQGEIFLQGQEYNTLQPAAIRSQIAASLQGCKLFSTSLRDNFLRLHPGCQESAIWHSLELAQLADYVRQLPQQFDTPLGLDACRLSGGQRNRLLTALALTSQSPILFLDEPTAGLNQETAQVMMTAIIQHLNQTGKTLLVITHDLLLANQLPQCIPISQASH